MAWLIILGLLASLIVIPLFSMFILPFASVVIAPLLALLQMLWGLMKRHKVIAAIVVTLLLLIAF